MSFLKYRAEVSVDSKSILLKNITTLSEYNTAIPGIDTEGEVASTTTAITIAITSEDGYYLAPVSIITREVELRSAAGALITLASLTGSTDDVLLDNLYTVTIIDTISSVAYTTTLQLLAYQQVKNQVARAVISSDWKDSFNYMSKNSYSKYTLKLKSWLDQMILANANGLYTEAKTILDSLKSIL